MLRYLKIDRLAVIDALAVEFAPGFNVLTGETGAGKSIVVEAIDLLTGGRASADLVRTGAENAQIQAVLERADGSELIVRREITAAGRSRAFVDGDLVTAAALAGETGPLIELHGQHEHQTLLTPASHLALLDRFGSHDKERADVAARHAAYREVRDALDASQLDERERAARLEVIRFQLDEFARVDPRAGEDDDLAVERRILANADRLQSLATEAYSRLYEDDGAVAAGLAVVWRRVEELARLDPSFAPYLDWRPAIDSQLDELTHALRRCTERPDAAPERLQQIEDRLALLERLKKKYGPSLDAAMAKRDALQRDWTALDTSHERTEELRARLDSAQRDFLAAASTLSAARRESARQLGKALEKRLAGFAMAGARCEFRFTAERLVEARWGSEGFDEGELFLAANQGEEARPLARIASGGELSRIMLALETLTSGDLQAKTLVFDEVDAGIGGRVADEVGARLRELGDRCQVLCITHLPQVAAYGQVHFRVDKQVRQGRTVTLMTRLSDGDRVGEIARMIGGATVTPAVLKGAADMLENAGARGEQNTKGESERIRAKVRKSSAKS